MFERRIITDGTVFKIEHRIKGTQETAWFPYPWVYQTIDEARAELARMNADAARTWQVVD